MKCPQCGESCERDEIDNGVGMEAVGPWGCRSCNWVEDLTDLNDLMRKCACTPACSQPCKGQCGCKRCHDDYMDFLSVE